MSERKLLFTATWVARAPIVPNKQVEYWDSVARGLSLRVSPGGTRTYCFTYRHGRVQRRMKLGTIDEITLADVREVADKHRAAVRAGKDPAYLLKQSNQAETFSDLAKLYIEKQSGKLRRFAAYERMINKDLLPAWRTRRVSDISRRDVRRVTEAIAERGAPIMANRVQALASMMFAFAIDAGIIGQNPCFRLKRLGQETIRRVHLRKRDEFQALWGALEKESLLIQTIVKLLLFTAQRTGEVLNMKWSNVDLDGGLWTIPAIDAKNKNEHEVPLSETPVQLLKTWKKHIEARIEAGDQKPSEYVFSSNRGGGLKPVQNIQRPIQRIRKASKLNFNAHDLRRTAATLISEAEKSDLLVERLLNHKRPGIRGVYNHATFAKPLRSALQRWDSKINADVLPSKVLKFGSERG